MAARVKLIKNTPSFLLTNKDDLRVLQSIIARAATEALKEHGFAVSSNGGRLGSNLEAQLNFKITPTDRDFVANLEKQEFDRWAPSYGRQPSDYMRQFIFGNDAYYLIGFNNSRRKYCVRGRAVLGGKTMLFGLHVLSRLK